jgi:predicted DsbA family dithiol-disulfide isomerase
VSPVRFVVYSDYLCPWCYNASVRLRALEDEYAGRVVLDWRSYLLRPNPRSDTDPASALEKFRRYTESWRRPAAEPDSGEFTVWSSDAGPPSHSVPAHRVAKAARALGPDAFRAVHDRLLRAYFSENQDISDVRVQRALWAELGLPDPGFDLVGRDETLDQVLADHREALAHGATGVPAVRLVDNPAIIVGAHPIELYRRWIERTLERRAGDTR